MEAPNSDMGAFMDNMKNMVTNVMTEVQSLVSTARQSVVEAATTTQEPLKMPDLEDIPKSSVQEECIQSNPECPKCKGSKINKHGKPCKKCTGTGECTNEHVPCFKCKGTLLNPKGKPCKKCKQTGKFCLNGEVTEQAREEIKALCNDEFMKLYKEHKAKLQ